MLGLGRRLKARNSLWDLVNKHPTTSPSTNLPYPTQAVEEGAGNLPPLPTSPTSPLSSTPSIKFHSPPLLDKSPTANMPPVLWSLLGQNQSGSKLMDMVEERYKEVATRSWGGPIWCVYCAICCLILRFPSLLIRASLGSIFSVSGYARNAACGCRPHLIVADRL